MSPALINHLLQTPKSKSAPVAILQIIIATFITAIAAQISIPLQPVPFTLQTLAVLASGLLLGSRKGAAAQLAYILLGTLGAPIFANFSGGPLHLFGPTGGYLIAFIPAAYLAGLIAEVQLDRQPLTCFLSLLLCNAVVLFIGTVWLAKFLQFDLTQAIAAGVTPFIFGELIKVFILTFIIPITWKLTTKTTPNSPRN